MSAKLREECDDDDDDLNRLAGGDSNDTGSEISLIDLESCDGAVRSIDKFSGFCNSISNSAGFVWPEGSKEGKIDDETEHL
jgi:hypothetical protein